MRKLDTEKNVNYAKIAHNSDLNYMYGEDI